MKRRNFVQTVALSTIGLSINSFTPSDICKKNRNFRGTFSQTNNRFSIYTNSDITPTRVFHITDTHLSLDDLRGAKYAKFSKRMAGAYKSNLHFKTGGQISTKESFEMTLDLAKKEDVDFLALTGDIFSFPSQAAVEWALQKLNDTGIPFAYVAGNHDWHYEGMNGSSEQLRETWIQKHLKPIYNGKNPLYDSYDINGLCFVCIDNSTYEILPEQLNFFKNQVKKNTPLILLMHIPLYMPGRSAGFGCGNPIWGEKTDKNYVIEGREKWRKNGHTNTTFSFLNEVFNSPNLLAVLAGHTHHPTIDVKNGIPQIVSAHNATAYYSDININSLIK